MLNLTAAANRVYDAFLGCWEAIMENSGWILEACAKLIAILSGLAAVISIDAVIIALVYACFTVPQFLFYDHVVANGKEEKMLNSNAFIRRKMVAYIGGYSSDVSKSCRLT